MNKFIDNMIVQTLNDMLPEKVTEKLHKAFHFYDFRNKEFSEIGIKLTLTYFISIPIIIFILDAKKPTELSGYGDFLAGFFSPIAFGWLVIGYLMQNKELKNSVEQTGEAQRLARDQLDFQKKIKFDEERKEKNRAQPFFQKMKIEGNFPNIQIDFKNLGGSVHSMTVYGLTEAGESGASMDLSVFNDDWEKGKSKTLMFDFSILKYEKKPNEQDARIYRFHVTYIDSEANFMITVLTIHIPSSRAISRIVAAFKTTLDIKE